MFEKLVSFTKKVSDLADRPSSNPKAQFDAAPDEVRQYLNKLIDSLQKTESGDSGAKNIGATAISGLDGTNVQSLLESIKTYSDNKFLNGNGQRVEIWPAMFFTNGGSNTATATVSFSKAFVTPPAVSPANVMVSASYIDTIRQPYITVTNTGFTVKITTGDSNVLGTVGTPVNVQMNFLVVGK
jgi:hypothetical protein